MSVLGQDMIERNRDQTTIAELLRGTVNLLYAGSTDAPIIRGTDTKGPVSAGNAYLSKPIPGATISVDGRYLTSAELNLGAAGLWDVDSVEVYRGPQTSSQGANSIAGAVVINTREPTFTPEAEAQALAGSRNKQRYSATVSGPLTDEVAARLAIDYSQRDTFIDYTNPDFTADSFDLDWKTQDVRAKVLWQPSVLDGFSGMFTYGYTKVNRPNSEVTSQPYDDLDNVSLYQDNQETDSHVSILDLSYEISESVVVSNQLQYSEGDYKFHFAAPYEGEALRSNENVSNDLRFNLATSGAPLSGVIGVFLWDDKTNNALDNTFGNADADLRHQSLSPYGEVIWRFSPHWRLTAGARYQVDEISHHGAASYVPNVIHDYDKTFTAFLPKLALAYEFSGTSNIGVLVNRGYIPGGTGINFRGGEYYTFDEEYAWNYEVFTRQTLLDQRLSLNANLFYTVFKDSQRSVTDYLDGRPFGSVIINADEAISQGLEISIDFQANAQLQVSAGLGVLDTEISDFSDYRGEEFVGKEFSKAPGYMANFRVEYQISRSFSIGGDVNYTDSYFSNDTNDPELRVTSFSLVNLHGNYRVSRQIELFGYGRNLFDKRAPVRKVSDSSTGGINAYLVEPREFGLGIKAKF